MIASLADATLKQYTSCYRRWWNFCYQLRLDPYNPTMTEILNFLSNLFQEGLSFSSINIHRSALNFFFNLNEKDLKTTSRFLKGVYNKRPACPKYTNTWDPQPVLNYLENMYPFEKISLKAITLKLVTLLALTTAHRVQTLSKISLANIYNEGQAIRITIPAKIKTSGIGRNQPILTLPYFKEKPGLCVASTLEFYLEKTKSFRAEGEDTLLYTYRSPHKPASSQTISRWIKELLRNSGIDTIVFSSHSVRRQLPFVQVLISTLLDRLPAGRHSQRYSISFITNLLLITTRNLVELSFKTFNHQIKYLHDYIQFICIRTRRLIVYVSICLPVLILFSILFAI